MGMYIVPRYGGLLYQVVDDITSSAAAKFTSKRSWK